jgi:hypothetical protein
MSMVLLPDLIFIVDEGILLLRRHDCELSLIAASENKTWPRGWILAEVIGWARVRRWARMLRGTGQN